MDFEEFSLRYQLTRRQRLIPHLRLWASHSPEGLGLVLLSVAFALFVGIKIHLLLGFIPALISLLITLLVPMFFVRGFYIGLLNVLLFRRRSVHLIVKESILECSGLFSRFGMSLEETRSFKQYTDDTWTLYHASGIVITIPSSELTEDQVEHFQGWAEEAAAEAKHSIRNPQPKKLSGSRRIECHTSKIKLLGLVGAILVLIGAFYFLTTLPQLVARVIGWSGVGLCGLGLILVPRELFHRGPQVVINDEGIEDRRQRLGVIRWEDIRELAIWTLGSSKFLGIEVADPEVYLSRRPRRNRWGEGLSKAMGYPTLEIHFAALSPGLMEVWAHLEAQVDDDGQPAAP